MNLSLKLESLLGDGAGLFIVFQVVLHLGEVKVRSCCSLENIQNINTGGLKVTCGIISFRNEYLQQAIDSWVINVIVEAVIFTSH